MSARPIGCGLAALLALALGCAAAPAPRDTGRLFLWSVESRGPGGGGYLLGSVHMADPDLVLDPAIEAAFGDTDLLVVELDLEKLSLQETRTRLLARGRLPPGQQLDQLIDPASWQTLDALLRAHGQSAEAYRGLEPWVAIVVVSGLLVERQGLSGEAGVDRLFLQRAGDARPVVALETLDDQLAIFDELPLPDQVTLLEALLDDPEGTPELVGALYEAWKLGDVEYVSSQVLGAAPEDPELAALEERMIRRRNRAMAERIDALLAGPERPFVVVGAAHMVGAEGLPALLAARGHRVRQLERSR